MNINESTELSRPPKRLGTVGAHRTNQKSRYWLITHNFPRGTKPDALTAQDKLNIRAFNRAAQVHPCTFCVYQGELGEETQTFHIQAYCEFATPVTMPAIKKHFGINSLHCEIRLGSQEQAIAYCTKEETRVTEIYRFGTPVEQKNGRAASAGKRTDLTHMWQRLKAGDTIYRIIDENPSNLRYVSLMQKAQFEALRNRKRTTKTICTVLYGAAGTGKTTTAINFAKTLGAYYLVPNDGKQIWWNGYDPLQHESIIFDEFNGSKMPLTFLNQLLDAVDLRVQTKGGFLPFLASHVVITSNFAPRTWYAFDDLSKNLCWDALSRRIDNLVQFRMDVHIADPGQPQLNKNKLHLEVEKGGFDRHWIKSPLELDEPLTPVILSDDEPAVVNDSSQEDSDALNLMELGREPHRLTRADKGKRKVPEDSERMSQPRYRDTSYGDSSEPNSPRVALPRPRVKFVLSGNPDDSSSSCVDGQPDLHVDSSDSSL